MRATNSKSEYGVLATDLISEAARAVTEGDHPHYLDARGYVYPDANYKDTREAWRVGIAPDGTTFLY